MRNFFQLRDIAVNNPAKLFISNKYNSCFSEQVPKQLVTGTQPVDVKVSVGLTELKPLYAQLIVNL